MNTIPGRTVFVGGAVAILMSGCATQSLWTWGTSTELSVESRGVSRDSAQDLVFFEVDQAADLRSGLYVIELARDWNRLEVTDHDFPIPGHALLRLSVPLQARLDPAGTEPGKTSLADVPHVFPGALSRREPPLQERAAYAWFLDTPDQSPDELWALSLYGRARAPDAWVLLAQVPLEGSRPWTRPALATLATPVAVAWDLATFPFVAIYGLFLFDG